MSCNKKDYTITFDEKVKGWTSFHSYHPDFMMGMNNKFFTFSGGNLYKHNSDTSNRNNFYGVEYPSKISLMINESPSDIKFLQAVSLEGSHPWETSIEAYVSDVSDVIKSSLKETDFTKKEGLWYAHARRNEDVNQTNSRAVYGIGEIISIGVNQIVIKGGSSSLTSSDVLLKGSDLSIIATVDSHSESNGETTIITTSDTGNYIVGDFVLGRKNPRIEGGNLRGYTMRMDLEITNNNKIELFAVNSEVKKSYT